MKKTNVIAVCNQKGGVGKTATAVSMSIALAHEGKKVLLVDFDSQGDSTYSLGWYDSREYKDTIASLMKKVVRGDEITEREAIRTHKEGIDVIPANDELSDLDMILVTAMNREKNLKTYLNEVKKDYDYVILDCPPSLGILTINALTAANSVIIPVQAEPLPAKDMTELLRTISRVKRSLNPKLRIDGILMTFIDNRNKLTAEVSEQIRRNYGSAINVFDTEIPVGVNASRATAVGKSIFAYDRSGEVAKAYKSLVKEVLGNEQKRENRVKSADAR